jgi:hypothetical protein
LRLLSSPEQERQFERAKQMALAELRSYPAKCAGGSDSVCVTLSGHRSDECFGSVAITIFPKRKVLLEAEKDVVPEVPLTPENDPRKTQEEKTPLVPAGAPGAVPAVNGAEVSTPETKTESVADGQAPESEAVTKTE